MSDVLLEVENLSVGYGEGVILSHFSFALRRGASLAVLGRNGVGKSTLMLALMGHLKPKAGKIILRGAELANIAPYRRCRLGLGWVPQGREIFAPLTVEEHLLIAAAKGRWTLKGVYELFPRLAERRHNLGSQLSGGEQQMLAIGRALVTNPDILLLDEPLEGLAPLVAQDVARCISELVDSEGMAAILVEQHASFALAATRDALILERGKVVYSGASAELAQDRPTLERFVGLRKPMASV
jgi:branched-chain amino acid transport system ATP-binding protein